MPTNEEVARAIVSHHRELQEGLAQRVAALHEAAHRQGAIDAPRHELLEFLSAELLPHAAAEERTLYVVGDDSPAVMLVAAMIAEHRAIGARIQELELAGSALEAACTASSIQALFEIHLEKENDRLLPVLVADQRVSLVDRLAGMHEILGEEPAVASDSQGEAVVDVRSEPPARRHGLIFDTFEALAPGGTFVLVNDHDPKPLYYQFAAERDGEFSWEYLEQGPETWRVRIGRTASAHAGPVQ